MHSKEPTLEYYIYIYDMKQSIVNTRYSVCKEGYVYGLNGNKLKPAIDKKGYKRVGLMINGTLKSKRVHRLVAETFIPNINNKPCVNHINGIKTDNRIENLEWVTHRENTAHAILNGLFSFQDSFKSKNITPKKGVLNGMSKLTQSDVDEIRKDFKPRIVTRKLLAKKYNVTEHCIKDVITFKSWK